MSSSNDESIMASSSVKLYQANTLPSATSTSIPSPEPLPGFPLNYPQPSVGEGWVLVLALIMFYKLVVLGGNHP